VNQELQNLFIDLFDITTNYVKKGSLLSFENHVRKELWKRQFACGYKLLSDDIMQSTPFHINPFGLFCFDLVVDINDELLVVGEIKERNNFSDFESFYYFCGQADILSAYLLFKQKSYTQILKLLIVTGNTDWRILTSSMYFGVYPITRWTCRYYRDLVSSLIEISSRCFVLYGKCQLQASKQLQQASSLCCLYWLKKVLSRRRKNIRLDGNSLIIDLRFLANCPGTYRVKRGLISTMEQFRHIHMILKSNGIDISDIVIKLQRRKIYDQLITLLLESIFSEEEKNIVRKEYE